MKNLLTISLTAIITAGFMFTIQGHATSSLWHIIEAQGKYSTQNIDVFAFEDRDNICYIFDGGQAGGIHCTKK
jgi:hypothetical protein